MSKTEEHVNKFIEFLQEQSPEVAQEIIQSNIAEAWMCLLISVIFFIICFLLSIVYLRLVQENYEYVVGVILSTIGTVVSTAFIIGFTYDIYYAYNFQRLVVLDYVRNML